MSPTRVGLGAVAAAAGLLLLTGCDADRRAIDRTDLRPIDTEPELVVELSDDGFDPATIVVDPDTLVLFVNVSTGERGVRSDLFDTGLLLPDEFSYVVVDTPGTHELVDRADPTHTATLEVRPGP